MSLFPFLVIVNDGFVQYWSCFDPQGLWFYGWFFQIYLESPGLSVL